LSGSLAIDVICFLLLLAVLVSLGQFGFQAMEQMPDGERFITISPLWVCSHLVRAIGLLILVWQLFWYGKAIERVETPEEIRALSFRHGRLWTWVTIVLLAFMAYGGIMVVARYLRY
jgi:H+/Cl- antiporter ClcA